jgi:hypothetical protein
MDDERVRYGRALIGAMAEVLDEIPDDLRPHVLETADYWLSVGLTLALERPTEARALLELVERETTERAAIAEDAAAFLAEVLG